MDMHKESNGLLFFRFGEQRSGPCWNDTLQRSLIIMRETDLDLRTGILQPFVGMIVSEVGTFPAMTCVGWWKHSLRPVGRKDLSL